MTSPVERMSAPERRAYYIREAQWFRKQAMEAHDAGDMPKYHGMMEDYLAYLAYAEDDSELWW